MNRISKNIINLKTMKLQLELKEALKILRAETGVILAMVMR